MPETEILLPKMGESVAEATIVKWLKAEGDPVEADEALVEIATDKVDSEVPSPQEGKIVKILCQEGDVIQVGKPIAIISSNGSDAGSAPSAPVALEEKSAPAPKEVISNGQQPVVAETTEGNTVAREGSDGRFYSPLVRSIAQAEGISMQELERVKGTGAEGRVTKKDILAYLPNRKEETQSSSTSTSAPTQTPDVKVEKTREFKAPAVQSMGGDEIIEMDRMRKLISDHMVMSKHVSPHVTSYVEADVTNIVEWRNRNKSKFEKKEGEKLTFTPIFIEAVARALRDFPMVNVSVDGNNIIKRKHINIGMATALPSGNLIVPVIKDADQYNLVGLAKKVNDLAARARINKLLPDEIQGGTYTLTNVGTFGNVMGTPIINQPQAAILAVGAIRKKPAVIETPHGDFIGIRHMMFLSHAYDHRIIDGALGGSFVRKVADYLEQFDTDREI